MKAKAMKPFIYLIILSDNDIGIHLCLSPGSQKDELRKKIQKKTQSLHQGNVLRSFLYKTVVYAHERKTLLKSYTHKPFAMK